MTHQWGLQRKSRSPASRASPRVPDRTRARGRGRASKRRARARERSSWIRTIRSPRTRPRARTAGSVKSCSSRRSSEICQACGVVYTASVLQTTLNWTEDGSADGMFLQDGAHVGAHLAAARAQMVSMSGRRHRDEKHFTWDRESTNLYHISKSVEHTGALLKLNKDIIAEVKDLVTRASDGEMGTGFVDESTHGGVRVFRCVDRIICR